MRAAVARAIVSAGLLPMIGLHHANRSNAFGLADDLVEPLRPVVDGRVARLIREHTTAIDRASKQALLELLTVACDCGDQSGPLMVQLHRYTASLVKCLSGENKQLDIPTARQAERF